MIIPDWPVPSSVRSIVTTRMGGESLGVYERFNLATHVGDDATSVKLNRKKLRIHCGLSAEPAWLQQVHGTNVVDATYVLQGQTPKVADASYSTDFNAACVVMTADCLPILFCNKSGSQVAATHAGWRGLAAGIVTETVKSFSDPAEDIIVWLGPAISQQHFEVGDEVRQLFEDGSPANRTAFVPSQRENHWYADLYALAKNQLLALGLRNIYGGGFCTFSDMEKGSQRFYSYRREGETGRFASLIWLDKPR